LHSGHFTLNKCKKNEKTVPLNPRDIQELSDYLDEMGLDPRVFKIINETPFNQMTDLNFDPNQPEERQLISQLGFHMPSTPEFPGDGFPKAPIHREKWHEQILRYAIDMGNDEAILGLADDFLCNAPKMKPNIQAAVDVLNIGIQRDFHRASYRLAQLMEEGKLGRKRIKEAVALYRQNAVFGDGASGTRLAWLFYKGRGVKRNTPKALYWFNAAAKLGNYESYGALCKIHFIGKRVPRDDIETYKWCDLAIATLHGGKLKRDAIRYIHRLADRMSDADIEKAYAKEESYQRFNKED